MKTWAQNLRFRILTITCILVIFLIVSTNSEYVANINRESRLRMKRRNTKQNSHAVIHMGIHKTGSTSIQSQSEDKNSILKLDGYEMPWLNYQEKSQRGKDEFMKFQAHFEHSLDKNQVNFATCFISPLKKERIKYPCNPDLLLHGLDIAEKNRNLFVSAETFDEIDAEGVNMLASYLAHWDEVTIIIYYRRFHSWIVSAHNQVTKKRKLANTELWEMSILIFVENRINNDNKFSFPYGYTPAVFERVKKRFDNVVVIDYADDRFRGTDESLFCHAMPNATNMCKAIRAEKQSVNANQKVDLDYSDLAYGAMKAGMINITSDEQMEKVTRAVQDNQEKTLKLKSSDFERICLPSEILGKLWQITSSAEATLFPERESGIEANRGRRVRVRNNNELRSDFDKAARTSLCKLDIDKTLGKEEWKVFFKGMKV